MRRFMKLPCYSEEREKIFLMLMFRHVAKKSLFSLFSESELLYD